MEPILAPQAGESLGDGVYDNDMLCCFRESTERIHRLAVVNEFSVNLVCDDEKVMCNRDIDDQLHFVMGQHLSGRIARVDDADRFGLRCDDCFDLFLDCILIALFCG